MKPPFRDRLVVLARRLATRAACHEDSARVGAKRLPPRSAWAVLAAAGIYADRARGGAARGGGVGPPRDDIQGGEARLDRARGRAGGAARRDPGGAARSGAVDTAALRLSLPGRGRVGGGWRARGTDGLRMAWPCCWDLIHPPAPP
ncbi:hypothetical protein AB5I41_20600 [Sphingomonas sp. MMS24-JH45]